MSKIIFHCTDLDSMIWYRKLEDMTVDDMRGRLLRTEPANEKMKMGTVFHAILEDPPDEINEVEKDGFKFKVTCNSSIQLPQIREIRANKTYSIAGMDITLSGGCDGITGNKVSDHKLTFRPNPDTYFNSFQWRAYLDIFEADAFKYIIYSAKEKNGIVTIHDVSTLSMYRYPEMVDDLKRGIFDLVEFCQEHVPEKFI